MQRKNQDDRHLRENYEDHSLHFLDWTYRFGLERSQLGRLLIIFEEKFQLRRFLFVLLFCLSLSWILNFEFKPQINYQVGDIVKSDVYSPMAFEMTDEVTTEEKRVKAESQVPIVFDYDPGVFDRVSSAIFRSFRLMRSQLRAQVWPKKMADQEEFIKDFFVHKGEFEKELGSTVSDLVFEWLVQNRFSARVENILIRNLDIWYQSKIVENAERTIPPKIDVLLARTVQKNNRGREFNVRRLEVLDSTNPDLFVIQNNRGLERASPKEIERVLILARSLVFPNLTMNRQEVELRREQARASVLPTTISVKKNQVILSEGATVQPYHMAVLKQIEILRSDSRRDVMTAAIGLLFFAIIIVFFQYLRRFVLTKVKVATKDILVMGVIIYTVVVVTKVFVFLTETAFLAKFGGDIPGDIFLFAAPVAAGPMLVGLLISSGEVVWLFSAFLAIVMGVMTDLNLVYMVYTLAGGIAGARGVYSTKKRSDLYWAGVRAGVINVVVVALMVTIAKLEQDGFRQEILGAIPAGFLGGLFSSMLAMTLIPLLESVFNYTTDVKLLELSNLNHPLLKEMIVKAPGTYHHSMLVGSMVEAAAEEIGANPLLGKVMCYYHDIGKMEHANYFIENQKPGHNPHDHISPYMSKTLLIAHVKDGVEMGMNHKLGEPIIDGIIQHHGTTLISYFFNKAVDLKNGDESQVAQNEFRYPGPKPQFREAALCMLADSIEAASRSLDEPTPVRLQNIVRNIVQRKFMEGQLDECSLTLRDLSKVESAFSRILMGIYHQRIDYPRSAGGGAAEAPVTSSVLGSTSGSGR